MTNWHSSDLSDRSKPTVVSLYSGAGGLDLGFAKAGFNIVFANDIDPSAVATHRAIPSIRDPRWRKTAQTFRRTEVVLGDVRDLGDQFERGISDVVIGGPPCQGFSVAGRMDPEDPRSKHVFDFLGIVARIRPRAFVMENVAALAQNARWSEVISSLQEYAGVHYKTQLVVLNASHWDVPQSRLRMFLIGVDHSMPGLDFSMPESACRPPTVRDALKQLPKYGEPGNDSYCTARITLAKSPVLRRSPFAGMLFNGQGRVINLDALSPTLPASMGGNRTPIVDQRNLDDPETVPWIVDYHRRLFVEGKPPLTKIPESVQLRRLTVEESAALQTFPDDMRWHGSQSAQFRQIGNAVPPLLAYAVARALRLAVF